MANALTPARKRLLKLLSEGSGLVYNPKYKRWMVVYADDMGREWVTESAVLGLQGEGYLDSRFCLTERGRSAAEANNA